MVEAVELLDEFCDEADVELFEEWVIVTGLGVPPPQPVRANIKSKIWTE